MNNGISDIKIGVLLPKSSLYPSIGLDIRDGLKARLSLDEAFNYKFIFENIGHGGNEKVVYDKAEKLIVQEEVAIVVAFLDHTAAAALDPLFAQTKRVLIVLDPGAHTPLIWENASPYRYTLSLQAALNSHITGIMAAGKGATKTFFSTSFYDAGYLHCNTYQKGFEKAGGAILYHAVVPFKIEEFNTGQFSNAIVHFKPDTVLAQFSAESGAFFLEKYKESGLFESAALYLSPFMLEESWIQNIPFPFSGMTGAVSWCSKLEHPENKIFIDRIRDTIDKDANVFSLLGWEAALLIIQLASHIKMNNDKISSVSTFRPAELISPRGKLSLHEASNIFFGPAYLAEVIENTTNGNCELLIKETLSYNREDFINEIPEGVFSKWTNTYLCI